MELGVKGTTLWGKQTCKYIITLCNLKKKKINPGLRQLYAFCNKASFYGGELLVTPPPHICRTPHPLAADYDLLLNIFTATLNIVGHSSICNLRTCHAVVTGAHLSHMVLRGCWCHTIVLNMHAPTEEKIDASKDSSCEELSRFSIIFSSAI